MSLDSDLGLPVPPERLTFGAFIHDVAERFGDNRALVFEGEPTTYRQLEEGARAVAKACLAAGVAKGAKIGLLVGNRPEFVMAAFGAAMVGVVVVPVSTLATGPERYHIVRHSDMAVLVVQEQLLRHRFLDELAADYPEVVAGTPGEVRATAFPFLRRVIALGTRVGNVQTWSEFLAAGEAVSDELLDAAASEVLPYDDVMIIYTSGTTAEPKAVVHTHRSVTAMLWRWGLQMQLTAADRLWSVFPFFWTAGFGMMLGGTLACGATLLLQDGFDAAEALAMIEREGATMVHAFAHTEAQLVDHPDAKTRDLSSLTRIRPGSPLGNLLGITEDSEDAWDLRSGYGASETFTISTALPADAPHHLRVRSHGLPLPGMRLRIVDAETGAPLPQGESGEITVRGVHLMRTYYKLAPEKVLDDEGWFHSQDAGYFDEEGYLHWHGRISGLIKTGGSNVSPVEVETRAMDLATLGVVSVVGVPHPLMGEIVVMCAVPLRDVEPDIPRVVEHMKATLAPYKIPRRILLFDEDDFGFTASDKVLFDELRRAAARRIVEGDDDDQEWVAYLKEYLEEGSDHH